MTVASDSSKAFFLGWGMGAVMGLCVHSKGMWGLDSVTLAES